jgi:putative thiamine transport system permease protein
MNDPELSTRFLASAGALLQLGVTAVALLIWVGIEHAFAWWRDNVAAAGKRLRHDRIAGGAALGAMLLSAAAVFGGLAVLALWSVAGLWQFPDALPAEITGRTWMKVAPRIGLPLETTLLAAALSTATATFLTLLCLIRENETGRIAGRGALALIYLPLIVPQVAFLFGLQLLFILGGGGAGLPSLVLAHLVFVLPYVFLSLSDPWRAYDRRYEAVAAGLGKSRLTSLLRVRMPMLLRAILTAAAVGFAVSVGQYLPTLLIGAGRLTTVTTEAVALASGGNRRVIGVYAFLQLALPALGFLVATAVPALVFRNRRALSS